jgi:hypothetical protein
MLKATSTNTVTEGATLPLLLPLRRQTADAVDMIRMRENIECAHLFILASELHLEMLVGS